MNTKTTWNLTWTGDKVLKISSKACQDGIDETMAACVGVAKSLVRVRTATLQGSIRYEAAKPTGKGGVSGFWGSFDVNYAIWQEIGTAKMKAQPYLRPAADAEYPRLVDRIRRHM